MQAGESAALAGSHHISTETAYADVTVVPIKEEEEEQATAMREQLQEAKLSRSSFLHVRIPHSSHNVYEYDEKRIHC